LATKIAVLAVLVVMVVTVERESECSNSGGWRHRIDLAVSLISLLFGKIKRARCCSLTFCKERAGFILSVRVRVA